MDDIREKIKVIVTDKLSVSDVDFEKGFSKAWSSLGADSLDTMDIIMALEKKFDVGLADEGGEPLTTPEKAYNYLSKLLKVR